MSKLKPEDPLPTSRNLLQWRALLAQQELLEQEERVLRRRRLVLWLTALGLLGWTIGKLLNGFG